MNNTTKWILIIVGVFVVLTFLFLAFSVFTFTSAISTMDDETYEVSTGAGERIALIELDEPIFESEEFIRQLKKYRDRASIKAVVLRLNSPGGAVAPSQEIFDEVKRTRDSGKPVVVSMSSVAASGAYYIACGANQIVANPGTITGSIGVISEFTNFKGLLDKIGIENTTIKSGKYKDAGNPSRPMTEDERQQLQTLIDDVYGQFVADVAQGRKLSEDSVRTLADGRIFTGRQAYALGLVDTLGTLETAIRIAGNLGKIVGEPKVVREKKRATLFERLMGTKIQQSVEDIGSQLKVLPPLEYRMSY